MQLQEKLDEFAQRGIEVAVVSCNTREVAEEAVAEWGLDRLTVGYGLTVEDAERWGLFVSSALKDTEPPHFVEPGTFVIRPDGELYASIVQTMPFSRPPASSLLSMLDWVIENDYPARGEYDSSDA